MYNMDLDWLTRNDNKRNMYRMKRRLAEKNPGIKERDSLVHAYAPRRSYESLATAFGTPRTVLGIVLVCSLALFCFLGWRWRLLRLLVHSDVNESPELAADILAKADVLELGPNVLTHIQDCVRSCLVRIHRFISHQEQHNA